MDFWSCLPEHFQKSVVKDLDYKSRCRLRKCSKSHVSLVDGCPIFLEYVLIDSSMDNGLHFTIGEHSKDFDLLKMSNRDPDEVIQDFLLIFKHKKSKIKKFTMSNYHFPAGIDKNIEALCAEISKIPQPFKLKIEELHIFSFSKINETNFCNLIKTLDSSVFKSIVLQQFSINDFELFKELMETEQWKNLKSIDIPWGTEIPLEWFLRTDNFSIKYKNLSGKDAWRSIKKYLSNPFPLYTYFRVHTVEDLPLADIFAHFDAPAMNQPLETTYVNDFYKHTQRFDLPWSTEYLFVVKIARKMIKGVICRKTSLLKDFDEMEDL